MEEVKQALFDDPRLGATREERQNRVFRGGLRIYTTLDPAGAAAWPPTARNDVLAEVAPEGTPTALVPIAPDDVTGAPRNATGAVVSVEPGTGAVRAMVGGAGFDSEQVQRHDPGRPLGRVDLQGVRAHGPAGERLPPHRQREREQPLHVQGHPRDVPRSRTGWRTSPAAAAVEARSPRRRSGRRTAPTCASGRSSASRRWSHEAQQMGITTPLDSVVSMPLGTKEVLPIDMAGAMASIAADGMWHEPYYIDRVETPDGQVIFEHEADPRRAASVQSARLACEVLEKNVQSGTGTRARIPNQHAAGKTGTAQNASDGWFVGFTPYLATAVWIGSPTDNKAVEIFGTGITGGSYPAEIWGRYMRGVARGPRGGRVRRLRAGQPELALPLDGPRQRLGRRDAAVGATSPSATGSTTSTTAAPGPSTTTTAPPTPPSPRTRPPPSDGGGDGGGTGGNDGGTGGAPSDPAFQARPARCEDGAP